MDAEARKSLRDKMSAYGLMDTLLARLNVVVTTGVAESTVYKAYAKGGLTPRLELILENAQTVLEQHEARIAQTLEMASAQVA